MSEIVVINEPIESNLQVFSQYLWQQQVSHRIIESEGRQLLLLADKQVAKKVQSAYQQYLNGETPLPTIDLPQSPQASLIATKLFFHLPVTLGIIILSILGFLLVYFDSDFGLVKHLTFFEFDRVRSSLVFSLPDGQYWRLLTPIFLHFSLMHIAFNMALLWFVGQRIELLQGSFRLLGISLVIGVGSNILQASYSEAAIFGGMSGVVYGLLGYGWVWSVIHPNKSLQIPNVIVYFSVVMMVFGFVGATAVLGAGKVANLAHLGGFIIGGIIGLGAALIEKTNKHKV